MGITNGNQLPLDIEVSQVETLLEAIRLFLDVGLPITEFSKHTRESYARDLRLVEEYLKGLGVGRLVEIGTHELRLYQEAMLQQGYKPATRQRKTFAIKALFRFLHEHGLIERDPAASLIPPSVPQKVRRFLTPPERERLLKACAGHPRDSAVITLLLETSLSVSEVARLKLSDIRLPPPEQVALNPKSTGTVRLKRRKDTVQLILRTKACRALGNWLIRRPRVASTEVFVTRRRTPLDRRSLGYLVKKYVKQANIKHASPKTLQHTVVGHDLAQSTEF